MRTIFLTLAVALLSGCMSTRVVFSEKWNPRAKPSYVDYLDYYWVGLKGDPVVALQNVCMDQRPQAFQRIKSSEDAIIAIVTLGIYSPATVKIWCGE